MNPFLIVIDIENQKRCHHSSLLQRALDTNVFFDYGSFERTPRLLILLLNKTANEIESGDAFFDFNRSTAYTLDYIDENDYYIDLSGYKHDSLYCAEILGSSSCRFSDVANVWFICRDLQKQLVKSINKTSIVCEIESIMVDDFHIRDIIFTEIPSASIDLSTRKLKYVKNIDMGFIKSKLSMDRAFEFFTLN